MTIRFDDVRQDAQGLPVVSWTEDRNIFAPAGATRARVACFIRPDANGVLQFAAAGDVRHGDFEEARPWQALYAFALSNADQQYYAPHDRALMDAAVSKNLFLRVALADAAHVLIANFNDERASVGVHINCASAAPVKIAALHDRLRREFIDKREHYRLECCDGEFVWPKDKVFEAYVLPKPTELPRWADWLMNAAIAVLIGVFGFGFYWLVVHS